MRDEIRSVIARVSGVSAPELDDDVMFRDELGVDSLKALEILAHCEREFNIELSEGECVDMRTVGEFISYVESRVEN